MTDRVGELLLRLNKLDLDTWNMLHWNGFGELLLDSGNYTPHSLRIDEYILFGTIRDAAIARGWWLGTSSVLKSYRNHVVIRKLDTSGSKSTYVLLGRASGESLSEATLAAYVSALEAQK